MVHTSACTFIPYSPAHTRLLPGMACAHACWFSDVGACTYQTPTPSPPPCPSPTLPAPSPTLLLQTGTGTGWRRRRRGQDHILETGMDGASCSLEGGQSLYSLDSLPACMCLCSVLAFTHHLPPLPHHAPSPSHPSPYNNFPLPASSSPPPPWFQVPFHACLLPTPILLTCPLHGVYLGLGLVEKKKQGGRNGNYLPFHAFLPSLACCLWHSFAISFRHYHHHNYFSASTCPLSLHYFAATCTPLPCTPLVTPTYPFCAFSAFTTFYPT